MKKSGGKSKGAKANYSLVDQRDAAYGVLKDARGWHDDLEKARIALAWRKEIKGDVDGKIVLGKCVKVSALHKEFSGFDFVIVLNKEFWDSFDDAKRLALVDHELCHAAPALDKHGIHRVDERGRWMWRMVKHEIEEFYCIVERHGCYKADLRRFAEAIRVAQNKSPQMELEAAE